VLCDVQEAQAEISKEKEKNQLVRSLTERTIKKTPKLSFQKSYEVGPGFLKKGRNFG